MLYRRSMEIEQRLDTTLRLIRTGKFSTPQLAQELHVSIPTVSRYVTALRARGHSIQAERRGEGWRFFLPRKSRAQHASDSVLHTVS
jgi:predicted DNA-binding transcriptional regulator YafY